MKSGILVLYKDKNMTSHDAVNKVRRLFGTKKVGHTGTLDPQATGILPILVGSAVKMSEYIVADRKKYLAEITFGTFTDTEDIWGNTTFSSEKRCTKEEFEKAFSGFVGEYMQIPPMVSAIKIGGKKLYELARNGIEIERSPRKCEIFSATVPYFDKEKAQIEVECSKGTYIRTLIFDLCRKIGIAGCMSSLERLESAGFTKEDAVTLEMLENEDIEKRYDRLLPAEIYFSDKKKVFLSGFFLKLIKNGCIVDTKKLGLDLPENEIVRLYADKAFFALGKIIADDGTLKLKKIKEFDL